MALDLFSSKKNVANTTTTVAVDSYNRAFNSVRNTADSNNLTIAVGPNATDAIQPGDNAVLISAVKAVAVVALLAAAVAWLSKKGS